MTLSNIIRSLLNAVDDVVFPPHCLLTGITTASNSVPISQQALDACLPAPSGIELMMSAQRHFEEDDLYISSFTALWQAGTPFTADGMNRPSIDRAIYAIKYGGRTKLAFLLGNRLGQFLSDNHLAVDFVTSVPIHSARRRERGYNQAEYIANGVAKAMHKQHLNTLKRTRYTGTQTSLSEHQRLSNVSDSFEVIDLDSVRGSSILIVDDVLTTGATLNSCAYALTSANARRVDAATLAAA